METNLLDRYPRTSRPIDERGATVTDEHRRIASEFGREFFDGDRLHGYGGYSYHPRFWTETAKRFVEYYGLVPGNSVLDVGCAKGFFLFDLLRQYPHLSVAGIDISTYAIEHAKEEVRPLLRVGNATDLPYPDASFDLVISINTIHNLEISACRRSVREIQRVSRGRSFIVVDAWRNEEEHRRFLKWNLTAKSFMHTDDWKKLFHDEGYTGDYYWFLA